MLNRLIITIMLLSAAWRAAAQIPSITTSSKLRFTEGNTIFDRTVGDIFSTIDVDLTTGVTGVLPVANGGTNISSYTVGDILYASGATTLSKLNGVATGNALISGGVSTAPSWGKIGLTTHVSGTLPVANGGTNLTTFAQGDIIYASASNTLSALAKNASATRYLSNTGASNNPAWAQVALTNGVTGTLPVANGGTGIATLSANYIPYGNGTSAFQSNSNLQYNGTTLTAQPRISMSGTESVGSNTSSLSATSILTGTANSLTLRGFRLDSRHNNDGTVTGNNLYGYDASVQFGNTNAATAGVAYGGYNYIQSFSPNISQLYGWYTRMDERSASGDLSNRVGGRFDVYKYVLDSDGHTAVGMQGSVQDQTTNGRWNSGTGMSFTATNCKTGYGALVTLSNTRGTANTQYGFYLNNNASGASTTVTNAYGLYLSTSAGTSGNITNYYGIYQNSTPTGATLAYSLYSGNSTNRMYHNGAMSVGVDDGSSAKVVVRGAGNTSGSTTALLENSSGTDIFTVRDDGMSSFGTSPNSTRRLVVRGASSDTTSVGFEVQRSSGTPTFAVRNDGKVTINNASPYELLTVPGKVRADGIVLTNQVASTSAGQIIYNTAGYYTLGDGTRATAYMPTMIEREVLGWAVNWTTGRKGAFWTVPARFDGWKISKAYIEVTAIGSGAGDDELTIEIGGVGEGVQIITAGTHTLVMDDVINTDDVITFNITQISATPAQGLNVSLELAKQ